MAGHHGTYPPEFKRQIVELVRSGRSPEAVAREFEPSAGAIRNWLKQADLDEGVRSDGLTTDERRELGRLKREVRQLRLERDILKKAAVDSTDQRNTRPFTPMGVWDGKDRSTGTPLGEAAASVGTLAGRSVHFRHCSGCWISSRLHLLDPPALRRDLPTATAPTDWGAYAT